MVLRYEAILVYTSRFCNKDIRGNWFRMYGVPDASLCARFYHIMVHHRRCVWLAGRRIPSGIRENPTHLRLDFADCQLPPTLLASMASRCLDSCRVGCHTSIAHFCLPRLSSWAPHPWLLPTGYRPIFISTATCEEVRMSCAQSAGGWSDSYPGAPCIGFVHEQT